jgi:hypothetical protein
MGLELPASTAAAVGPEAVILAPLCSQTRSNAVKSSCLVNPHHQTLLPLPSLSCFAPVLGLARVDERSFVIDADCCFNCYLTCAYRLPVF